MRTVAEDMLACVVLAYEDEGEQPLTAEEVRTLVDADRAALQQAAPDAEVGR
jgi:hypothetical protein